MSGPARIDLEAQARCDNMCRYVVKQNARYAVTKVEIGSLQVFLWTGEIRREDDHQGWGIGRVCQFG